MGAQQNGLVGVLPPSAWSREQSTFRARSGPWGSTCINAARYLLRKEPVEAFAWSFRKNLERFAEVDEITTSALKFPGEIAAVFTTSFGAADSGAYEVVGTQGSLRVDPGHEYAGELRQTLTVKGKKRERTSGSATSARPTSSTSRTASSRGGNRTPRAKGEADVRIIEALYRSAEAGKPVPLQPAPTGRIPARDRCSVQRP